MTAVLGVQEGHPEASPPRRARHTAKTWGGGTHQCALGDRYDGLYVMNDRMLREPLGSRTDYTVSPQPRCPVGKQ